MWTKNYKIICDFCGRFCRPHDEFTPYGCKHEEPYPEPHDPLHVCKTCWPEFFRSWLNMFKGQARYYYGDWQKSKAEQKAAKKYNYFWLAEEFRYIELGMALFCDSFPESYYGFNQAP